MSKDEEPMSPTLARGLKGGLLAAGAALAPSNPVVGAALVGLAELTGPGAGGFGAAVQNFRAWKRAKTSRNLLQRAEEEKLEPEVDAEQVNYFFAQAAPFVEDATTERKRQMMEDIIFNGLRNLADEAKRAEAIEALQVIDEMSDSSALLFAGFLKKLEEMDGKPIIQGSDHRENVPDCGLNLSVYLKALKPIYDMYRNNQGLSIGYLIDQVSIPMEGGTARGIVLTEAGKWLAEWLSNNRLPQPSEEPTD